MVAPISRHILAVTDKNMIFASPLQDQKLQVNQKSSEGQEKQSGTKDGVDDSKGEDGKEIPVPEHSEGEDAKEIPVQEQNQPHNSDLVSSLVELRLG